MDTDYNSKWMKFVIETRNTKSQTNTIETETTYCGSAHM
jgi:hypothetical protein